MWLWCDMTHCWQAIGCTGGRVGWAPCVVVRVGGWCVWEDGVGDVEVARACVCVCVRARGWCGVVGWWGCHQCCTTQDHQQHVGTAEHSATIHMMLAQKRPSFGVRKLRIKLVVPPCRAVLRKLRCFMTCTRALVYSRMPVCVCVYVCVCACACACACVCALALRTLQRLLADNRIYHTHTQ